MPKYQSQVFGLTIDMPNGWAGVDDKEFFAEKLKIPKSQSESTAMILVKIDENSVSKYISVTHDMEEYHDINAYKEALSGNLDALISAGCKIVSQKSEMIPSGYPVDHVMVLARDVLMSQYYVWFNKVIFCFATQVLSETDLDNIAIENIVFSMRKIDDKAEIISNDLIEPSSKLTKISTKSMKGIKI